MSIAVLRVLGRRLVKSAPKSRGRLLPERRRLPATRRTGDRSDGRAMSASGTVAELVRKHALGDLVDRRAVGLADNAAPQRVVRAEVRAALAARFDQGQIDDAVLVADELVGNAVQHTAGAVSFLIDVHEKGVAIAVADGGKDISAVPTSPTDTDRMAEDGRGMFIVGLLATAWSVAKFGAGKVVVAVIVLQDGT